MRLMLTSQLSNKDPLVLTLAQGFFAPGNYAQQGYKNFDVMCIGAAGGYGGAHGARPIDLPPSYNVGGGAGGGGGSHRIQGKLSDLPSSVPVVIGSPGSTGSSHGGINDPSEHGGDGGYSSFNGSLCQASGGKGGTGSDFSPTGNDMVYGPGGVGGKGGRTSSGGGPSYSSGNGTWNGTIGSGGAGGIGALIRTGRPPQTLNPEQPGRDGATSSNNEAKGEAGSTQGGGGANASALTGDDTSYGTYNAPVAIPEGAVFIVLT